MIRFDPFSPHRSTGPIITAQVTSDDVADSPFSVVGIGAPLFAMDQVEAADVWVPARNQSDRRFRLSLEMFLPAPSRKHAHYLLLSFSFAFLFFPRDVLSIKMPVTSNQYDAAKWIFTCTIWFRYSRERARQKLQKFSKCCQILPNLF